MMPANHVQINKKKQRHEIKKQAQEERKETEKHNGLSSERREIVLAFMDQYDKTLRALSK
jgi:hypothetical protein